MMAREYQLERQQLIPRPRNLVFAFFAEAANLEILTPEFLRFQILTPLPIVMQPGTRIDYTLQLCHIPFHWQTRIEAFEPPLRFTDVQLSGPYQRWHHLHEFYEAPGGTLVYDRVTYAVPYGIVGTLVHFGFVRRALKRIFDYRQRRLTTLFPPDNEMPLASVNRPPEL
jgi:ligand-binding SRPBCC domain-containing protein